jgi:hypothetical protein
MPRNLSGAVIAQITAQQLQPVLFVQMQFTSGVVYLWTGVGPLTATMPGGTSQTWIGAGNMGTITPVGETSDVAATGITLMLSGIPSSLIASALGEVRQGAPVYIWQAFLTTAGGIVASPYQAWSGRMDSCSIVEDATTATISITAENRLLDLQRLRERRYMPQDQTIDYPGDKGFDYVTSLQELSLVWGQAGATAPLLGGGTVIGHPYLPFGGPHGGPRGN